MTVTGMIPPAVEVTKHLGRPAQVLGAQAALLHRLAGLAGQLDHRAPGDALQGAAAWRQPAPVHVSEYVVPGCRPARPWRPRRRGTRLRSTHPCLPAPSERRHPADIRAVWL